MEAQANILDKNSFMQNLMAKMPQVFNAPKVGDVVEGRVMKKSARTLYFDLGLWGVGTVYGIEFTNAQSIVKNLKIGDTAFVKIIEIENEAGLRELSLAEAKSQKSWDLIRELKKTNKTIATKIISVNRGGLMIEVSGVAGFLPVSQLSLEHYPRVEDGDKNKILSILHSFVGQSFDVSIITADSNEEKLIVSEKAVFEKEMENKLGQLKIGAVVDGVITGVVDFGAFVKFGEMEGLVHISELAWQRIENPRDIVKVGQKVQAKIISIDKGRVSLSLKQLQQDPWLEAVKKYQIGQVVKGKVLKIMPFGVFVELDKDIQGLAHIMELSHETVKNPEEFVKPGQELEFKIISIEPAEHRLGLSLKALTEAPKKAEFEIKPEDKPSDEAKSKEPKPQEEKSAVEPESKQ